MVSSVVLSNVVVVLGDWEEVVFADLAVVIVKSFRLARLSSFLKAVRELAGAVAIVAAAVVGMGTAVDWPMLDFFRGEEASVATVDCACVLATAVDWLTLGSVVVDSAGVVTIDWVGALATVLGRGETPSVYPFTEDSTGVVTVSA